ncbi:MAG: FKBP-type peptidyl-prolyl cis-trans isomerase [Planctomycetota bacterium]
MSKNTSRRHLALIGLPVVILSSVLGCLPSPYGPSDADAPKEFTKTDSGLEYRILRKSEKKMPRPTSNVKVNYEGSLSDGTVFDSTYSRGTPAIFRLNEVVPGWTEGLQLIGEGGMIELKIPSELAYGKAGKRPSVPPDADLRFTIELIRVFD